jgi:predicted kinase
MSQRRFVLVTGPPGSGKTTLGAPLAAALGLSLIAKDAIKEALMDALGRPSEVEESRHIGQAAVKAMLAVAETSNGAVLDSTFFRETVNALRLFSGRFVEVRCCAPRDVVLARYRERSAERHVGHLDSLRREEELWNPGLLQPLGLGPVIEVDTTKPVDIATLVVDVVAAFAARA